MNHVIVPFKMEIVPIKKLALVNFENNPEKIYEGLELQYIDTENEGSGYRVIAYRNDKYVDVYDEDSLKIKDIGSFEVCQNGLANYKKVSYSKVCFERKSEGIQIEFALIDVKGRLIDVTIKENCKKKSKAFDLLAPIGVSSIDPVMLPVFIMYDFDLVRKKNTEISIKIDGNDIKPDPFPVPFPKDGQFRYFARYGYDCELVEFGRSCDSMLPLLTLDSNSNVNFEGLISSFQCENNMYSLKSIEFEKSKHKFIVHFIEKFPDIIRMDNTTVIGNFKMEMDESMGYISGQYTVRKNEDIVEIKLVPIEGWNVNPTTLLTKIMFGKKSIFRTWPKTYEYIQRINLVTKESSCSWQRINFTPKEKYV